MAPSMVPESSAPVGIGDDALVSRLRNGDAAAGDALVRRYARPLLRYLARLAGDELAEELHQQTWLSVLDNLEKFDATRAPNLTGDDAAGPPGLNGEPRLAIGSANPGTSASPTGSGGFKSWLFRIATNKANDHWRSRGREKSAKEGLKLITDEELPAAGHRLEGTEQEQKLRAAIDQLPAAQREVLMLRYYGNMKFVDIASTLGCPLNTALGRVHKAMIKLRQLMED